MCYNQLPSLLELTIKSLLRDDNMAISSLRSLPAELFPCLFLEAYAHRCWKTLKALIQRWPFDRLPLEALVQDLFPENETLKAVLDGIDVLLQQEVLPRNLQNQLEVFSFTNCTLTEVDLTHLFQSPHITHLKDLCLRGIPLTSVSEPLQALLEVNAATLQHLELGLCGLQDPQLEALLPALSSFSQLSSLSLHGKRLSTDTLEKLLCCTLGLQHLCLQLFPAPLENFSHHGVPQSVTFDLFCSQISKILQNHGYSRSIMVSSSHCSYCAKKLFKNWEPTFLPCFACLDHYGNLYFRLIGSDIYEFDYSMCTHTLLPSPYPRDR